MMPGAQDIKGINVIRGDYCLRLLHPLLLLFEYVFVWVCWRVLELLQGLFCAHRSIIQVNVVKVPVPVFEIRLRLMLDRIFQVTGQYQRHLVQLLLLRVSSYGFKLIGLVLWQLLHTTQTTKSQHLEFCTFNFYFLLHVSFNRVTIIREKKMQVQKVHSSSPVSSELFMKDFTNFTAPFGVNFRYM